MRIHRPDAYKAEKQKKITFFFCAWMLKLFNVLNSENIEEKQN